MGVPKMIAAGMAALVAALPLSAPSHAQNAQATPDPSRVERARALLHEALELGRALPVVGPGNMRGGWAMERRPLILARVAESLSRIDNGSDVRALIEQARQEADVVQSTGILQVAQHKVDMRVSLALAQYRVGDEQGARTTLASLEGDDPRAPGTYANVYGPEAVASRVRLADVWLEVGDRAAALAALREAEAAVMDDDPYQYSFVARELAARGFVTEAEALAARIAGTRMRIETGNGGTPLASAQLAIAEAKVKANDPAGAAAAANAAVAGSRRQCRAPSLMQWIDDVRRRAGDAAGADALWRELAASGRLVSSARERSSELACLAGLQEAATDKTEALTLIGEAATAAQPISNPSDRAYVSTQINAARIRLGERDAAAAALPEELAFAQRIRDRALRFSALVRVARTWLEFDRKSEARAVLAEALGSAGDPNSLVTFGRNHRVIAQLQAEADDLDGAVNTTHLITDPTIRAHALVGLAEALLSPPSSDTGREQE